MRSPDFVIGGAENPYLLRWWLIPRNRWLNVYLHRIVRDDDPRALHDHPWWNVSIVLKGGYLEWRKNRSPVWRGPGSVVFRPATLAHRLTLGANGKPAWSLLITGPKVRDWGFHCAQGWRSFRRTELAKQLMQQRDRAISIRDENLARVNAAGLFGTRITGRGLISNQRRRTA